MKNFLAIEDFCSYADSAVSIIPVPYEATTSYIPGTKNGPQAIIDASEFVELYDGGVGNGRTVIAKDATGQYRGDE